MPNYSVKALNKAGEIQEFKKHYPTEEAMKAEVVEKGLMLMSFKEARAHGNILGKPLKVVKKFFASNKISDNDVVNLFYELGIMLRAGVPILSAVKMTMEGIEKTSMQKFLEDVSFKLKEGKTFSGILTDHQEIYDFKPITPIIQMGEKTGKLSESFLKISNNIERWVKIKSEIVSALIYPIILLVTSLVAIYIILTYVIPKFEDIITGFKVALPWYTNFLFKFSIFFTKYEVEIIGVMVFLLFVLLMLLRNDKSRKKINDFFHKIPFVRNIRFTAESIKFLNALSDLLYGGVPILLSLNLASENFTYQKIRDKLRDVADTVKKGGLLGTALKDAELFPEIVPNMIRVGEESGSLPEVLNELSNFMSEKFLKKIKRFMSLLEPFIIIFIAFFIGFLVLSILPIVMNLGDLNV